MKKESEKIDSLPLLALHGEPCLALKHVNNGGRTLWIPLPSSPVFMPSPYLQLLPWKSHIFLS